MEYAIVFTQTIQTSEDSWDAVKRVIHVSKDTTIGQIEDAYKKAVGSQKAELIASISPVINVIHITPIAELSNTRLTPTP